MILVFDNHKYLDDKHSNLLALFSNHQPVHFFDLYASPYYHFRQPYLNNQKESIAQETNLHTVFLLGNLL